MIYLPKTKRIQLGVPVCENFYCVHRPDPQAKPVAIERPYSQTLLTWTNPQGYKRQRATLLCCDCRDEVAAGTTIQVGR